MIELVGTRDVPDVVFANQDLAIVVVLIGVAIQINTRPHDDQIIDPAEAIEAHVIVVVDRVRPHERPVGRGRGPVQALDKPPEPEVRVLEKPVPALVPPAQTAQGIVST